MLMLMQATYKYDGSRPIDGRKSLTSEGKRKRNTVVRQTNVDVLYPAVCALFAQYDAAASCLDDYDSIEDLVLPFLKIDRATLLFAVVDVAEGWAYKTLESLAFPEEECITKTHPKLKRAYADLNPAEKTNDDECRKLAAFFLDDFDRCGSLEQTRREFGEFDAHRDSVANIQSNDEEAAGEPQQRPKITDYVHSKFQVLRTAGYKFSNSSTYEAF